MKPLAKWSLDQLKEIPEDIACTSKSCVFSVPQSRERILKVPVSELIFCAPTSKKRQYHDLDESGDNDRLIEIPEKQQRVMHCSANTSDEKCSSKQKGIKSTLYEARSASVKSFDQH